MPYDVFVYPVGGERNKRLDIGVWFKRDGFPYNHNNLFPNKFIVRECGGELDYYAVFNTSELLEVGKEYENLAKLPKTLDEYLNQVKTGQVSEHWMDKHHYKLLDYFANFQDDDTFNVEAIYWESGIPYDILDDE